MEDAQIIALYLARDESAIQETQLKYGRLCLHIAENILGNTEDAEECVQDAYLALWNQIPPARPRNITAFVCKITRNLALKKLEYVSAAKRSTNATVSLCEIEEFLPDERFTPETESEELGGLISAFCKQKRKSPEKYSCADIGFSTLSAKLPGNLVSAKTKSNPYYSAHAAVCVHI